MKEKVGILEKIETEQIRSEYRKETKKLWENPYREEFHNEKTFPEFEQKMWNKLNDELNTCRMYRITSCQIKSSPKFEQELNKAIEQVASARQENRNGFEKEKVLSHFLQRNLIPYRMVIGAHHTKKNHLV